MLPCCCSASPACSASGSTLPAETIVFGRTAVAAAVLGMLLWRTPARWRRFDWRMAVNGAVLAVHWFAFFKAIQIANVATGLLGFASFPLFVLLLELALLRAHARGVDWATAGLVVGGLLVLVPEPSLDNRIVQGLAWGVLSGFSFALLAVSNRALAARRAPTAIAFWQNVCAAACLAPALAISPVRPDARELALLLVLGVVCTALAHTLFIRSMRVLSAHTASVVAALEPVYGIVAGRRAAGRGAGRTHDDRRRPYRRRRAGGQRQGCVAAATIARHGALRYCANRAPEGA